VGSGVRTLIVDDQPNVRLLLSRILRKKIGCTVSEATNGLEALDLLGRQHFDLVVLDVLMPLMDGIETLEAIRRTPSLRHLPVIVLSAVRDEGKVRQLVGHGITAYLAKPLRPLDVAERIQAIMTRLAATQGLPARSLSDVSRGSRVVVVDGDADFRRVVAEALGEYRVSGSAAGADGLRVCLAQRPALVIVGQELGALGTAALLRKLRGSPDLSSLRIVAAVTGDVRAPVEDADAVIERTLVAGRFRQQFTRLLMAQPPEQHVLTARADLRRQMILATEQVFGMMLGIEVLAVAEAQASQAGDDVVHIALHLEQEACDLEFAFAAPRSMSERMTAQFLQAGDVVTDADVSATLSEMATIISGRLQTSLRHRGDSVTLGDPRVSRVGREEEPDAGMRVCFASAAQDLRFMTTLRAVPRPALVQDTRASASRTSKMNAQTPPPPPVDPEVLEMLASLQEPGEPDLVVELVTLFLRDTPERLAELTGRPVEAATAARVAHAVKGSAGNLGATGLQELAGRLEQAGHRGEAGEALADLVAAVHAEYARVERHLRGVLAERAGADSALLER
jgi:two-component system chemotaxis response regulator CheY